MLFFWLAGVHEENVECEILTKDGEVLLGNVPKVVVLSGRYVDATTGLPVLAESQIIPQMLLIEEATLDSKIRNLASHQEEEASLSIFEGLTNHFGEIQNHGRALRTISWDKYDLGHIPQAAGCVLATGGGHVRAPCGGK